MSTMAPNARVGLVGYGRWGARWARILSEAGCLGWIVDTDHGRRMMAKKDYSVPVYEELAAFELADTQGTIVATPPETHREVAAALLTERQAVLLEKPMCTTVEDANALSATARHTLTRLMVDHTFLYAPAVAAALKWIRERVGRIRHARYHWHNVRTSQDEGAVWNLGPHPVSISTELCRMRDTHVTNVSAVQAGTRRPGVYDVADASLQMADGSSEMVHLSNFGPEKVREFSVVGDAGSVVCRPNQREVMWLDADGKAEMWVERPGEERQPLVRILSRFLDSSPLSDEYGENGAHVVAMLEAMSASSRQFPRQEVGG